jgi:Alpha-2-macroglobulin family
MTRTGARLTLVGVLASAQCSPRREAEESNLYARAPVAPAAPATNQVPGRNRADEGKMSKRNALASAEDRPGSQGAIDNTLKEEARAEPEAPPTRAWFPETFLFAPLIVTDDHGAATVPVRVPDRLTTWRVLALAHSRAGAQAGAEASFAGTLPAYVDPLVPPFLMAGDEVALPIEVVNNTGETVTAPLQVEVTGATLARPLRPVRVEAQGRVVSYAVIRAGAPGVATVRVALGSRDAIERKFPVRATGRPVVETRRGTLAAPRQLDIELPAGVDQEGARARLRVFPGALAILRAEIAAAAGRAELAGDAYALLLAGRGEALLRALGGEPAPRELRALAIVAGQRVIRAARSPDTVTAAMLAEAALAHPASPVLARLGERLAETVAAGQRPDGTFAGADGWTLQRLLATSAECVRAVRAASASPRARQRATRVTLRARTAFERYIDRVEDPYTAAAILAAGAVDGELRDRLRKRVREGVRATADGARALPVAKGIVRGDGLPPSEVEATALAVLALRDDQAAASLVPDLGGRLLAAYDPASGFGDGRTNLVALTAVLSLFRDPLPARVEITLSQDGRRLAQRSLEGPRLREMLALDATLPAAAGHHAYRIQAEPAVPGLAYALALEAFVPWPRKPANAAASAGLELSVGVPRAARVGRPVDVTLRAAAPARLELTIRQALPAGVQPDTASLDALVTAGTIASYDRQDGVVAFRVPALTPGQVFAARYRAIPTLAGTLTTAPSSISAGNERYDVAPAKWVVK